MKKGFQRVIVIVKGPVDAIAGEYHRSVDGFEARSRILQLRQEEVEHQEMVGEIDKRLLAWRAEHPEV